MTRIDTKSTLEATDGTVPVAGSRAGNSKIRPGVGDVGGSSNGDLEVSYRLLDPPSIDEEGAVVQARPSHFRPFGDGLSEEPVRVSLPAFPSQSDGEVIEVVDRKARCLDRRCIVELGTEPIPEFSSTGLSGTVGELEIPRRAHTGHQNDVIPQHVGAEGIGSERQPKGDERGAVPAAIEQQPAQRRFAWRRGFTDRHGHLFGDERPKAIHGRITVSTPVEASVELRRELGISMFGFVIRGISHDTGIDPQEDAGGRLRRGSRDGQPGRPDESLL